MHVQERVSLENCASEPIHIPGSIQANGVLLAFDDGGKLCAFSANSASMLGVDARIGIPYDELLRPLSPAISDVVGDLVLVSHQEDAPAQAFPVDLAGRHFDVVLHSFNRVVITEFELRLKSDDLVTSFALKAHQAINALKTVRNIEALLNRTVQHVAGLTDFDRVMAYRFRHDDSGDVVAEHRNADLEPYLGRRYPASDIPAQARRLYTINTLRIISDVDQPPVALLSAAGLAPLDLSQSMLRSVSPIHIEYLQNMGVGASMSISIVVNNSLWGLIACHHMSALSVPYSIRMTCDVLAQVVASKVQQILAREDAEFASDGAKVRTRLTEAVLHADDMFAALETQSVTLLQLLDADAMLLAEQSKLTRSGDLSLELATAIIKSLPDDSRDVIERHQRSDWPESLQGSIGPWVGLLALPFDHATLGWIIALRREEIETVTWGGKDEKIIRQGPNGPRLSPRGSFQAYKEIVRDKAKPWSKVTLKLARDLLEELRIAFRARHEELEQSRAQLLAMLGHDLRDPLNSISMATAVLQRGDQAESKVVQRISNASGRMQRLIADVLDMSRMQSGIGLGLKRKETDVSALISSLLAELQHSQPSVAYQGDVQSGVIACIDEDRLLQAIANLLGNARHHGESGAPVRMVLRADDTTFSIDVANLSQPIPAEIENEMFNPFKRTSIGNPRNRSGLGLGLYISHQISIGHGGSLTYNYLSPEVVFTLTLPLQP
jgi:light-regulated signal transduction histidine kinase (bacteriophytochrome)